MPNILKSLLMALPIVFGTAAGALSADWPAAKPITIIHAFAPGGDFLQRLVAEQLEKSLGQTVVFENRPGAGGATGTGYGARQAPDGYTLITAYPGPAANYTNTFASLTYKPLDDFVHISQLGLGDMILVARKDFPANTLAEVVAYIKANPGKVSAANVGIGSYGHMIELAFAEKAGLEFKTVPYKGSGPIMPDLLSGSVDLSLDYLGETYIKQLEAGTIKPIAVVSAKRAPSLPDTPTFQEAGVDLVAAPWSGIMAPKGTPDDIVNKINAVIGEYLATDEAREKFATVGQRPAHTTPQGFHDIVVHEEAMWRDLIKKYNIRND